jgi:hypothetical protein
MRLKKQVKSKKISFEYFVNVNNEGMFTTYLSEDIIQKFESCGIKINYGRGNRKGFYESTTLQGIEKLIQEKVDKINSKKLIETKIVIRYDIITSCSYCKTKKGEIVPNGYWQKRIDKDKVDGCDWFNGTHEMNSSNRSPYGFKLYVEVDRLNIYSFPDNTTHKEYVSLTEGEKVEGSTLDWLDSLTAMQPEDNSNIKEIDYTEELGLFFKNVILYICGLNEKLKNLFGDKIELTNKQLPLLKEFNNE